MPTNNLKSVTNVTFLKNKESTDLSTHVMLCTIRYESLESKLEQIENKVNKIIKQCDSNNKMVIRMLLIFSTGIIVTLLSTHFNFI